MGTLLGLHRIHGYNAGPCIFSPIAHERIGATTHAECPRCQYSRGTRRIIFAPPARTAMPHESPDYAAFLAEQLPRQHARVAHYALGDEHVWLKRAGRPHGAWRYRLLGAVARGARLPALSPVPNPGGTAAIATEIARLAAFAAHGLRVPEVLAAQTDGFLMRDLGGGAQAARSLGDEIEAQIPHGADAVLAPWREGLALLDAVHARGLCLSQAFARNMVRCADGQIACIDFEDDPAAHLPLPLCQVRDALAWLHSTAGFLHAAGARESARAIWSAWLAEPVRDDAFRAAFAQTVARLTWLRYLPPDRRWGRDAYRLRAAYEQAVKLRYE